jgi:hypothetical protein
MVDRGQWVSVTNVASHPCIATNNAMIRGMRAISLLTSGGLFGTFYKDLLLKDEKVYIYV